LSLLNNYLNRCPFPDAGKFVGTTDNNVTDTDDNQTPSGNDKQTDSGYGNRDGQQSGQENEGRRTTNDDGTDTENSQTDSGFDNQTEPDNGVRGAPIEGDNVKVCPLAQSYGLYWDYRVYGEFRPTQFWEHKQCWWIFSV
jgi:hypothetical protein